MAELIQQEPQVPCAVVMHSRNREAKAKTQTHTNLHNTAWFIHMRSAKNHSAPGFSRPQSFPGHSNLILQGLIGAGDVCQRARAWVEVHGAEGGGPCAGGEVPGAGGEVRGAGGEVRGAGGEVVSALEGAAGVSRVAVERAGGAREGGARVGVVEVSEAAVQTACAWKEVDGECWGATECAGLTAVQVV